MHFQSTIDSSKGKKGGAMTENLFDRINSFFVRMYICVWVYMAKVMVMALMKQTCFSIIMTNCKDGTC